jgi:hypothetical protein
MLSANRVNTPAGKLSLFLSHARKQKWTLPDTQKETPRSETKSQKESRERTYRQKKTPFFTKVRCFKDSLRDKNNVTGKLLNLHNVIILPSHEKRQSRALFWFPFSLPAYFLFRGNVNDTDLG